MSRGVAREGRADGRSVERRSESRSGMRRAEPRSRGDERGTGGEAPREGDYEVTHYFSTHGTLEAVMVAMFRRGSGASGVPIVAVAFEIR